jgi:hypothetical protein
MAISQHVLAMVSLRATITTDLCSILVMVMLASYALVNALFVAVGVVFDARLYLALISPTSAHAFSH